MALRRSSRANGSKNLIDRWSGVVLAILGLTYKRFLFSQTVGDVAHRFLWNPAAVGVAAVGYFQHTPSLYIFARISGAFIAGFGFVLSWARANTKPVASVPGQPARLPKWVYWMLYGGLALQITLKVWDISKKVIVVKSLSCQHI